MSREMEERVLSELKKLRQVILDIPDYGEALPATTTPLIQDFEASLKRGPCGMRHHHQDCDCGGMGGDR